VRFSVLARCVRGNEASVSFVGWIAEKIAPGRGEIDNEGSLRRLLRRRGVCALVALRPPFRRRLNDHLGDHKTARPSAFLARIDEVVEIAEALGRLRHPHLDAFLGQRGRGLVDRLAGSVVALREQDNLDDIGRELDAGEAADAEDRDAG
jgi:hypothetical protein